MFGVDLRAGGDRSQQAAEQEEEKEVSGFHVRHLSV
jgi:hypothetical protein